MQKHDARPVERPSGLVPPAVALDGVTELRLHGVGGTTPENLLADVAPQLVSGDGVAGFFRTADVKGRHAEAYSWGGLTSRSATRALWLLLLPFTLVNVAGWMCTPTAWRGALRFRVHRAVVRWAALGLTVNLLLLVAMTTMDVVAYQCGVRVACADRWWLRWLHTDPFVDHPARRVLVGALVPLLVAIGLLALSGRSLSRYEQVPPPQRGESLRAMSDVTPARPGVGLTDPDFWNGGGSVARLALLHLGAACGFVGWITAYTARSIPLAAGVAPAYDGLATLVTWLAAAAGLGAVLLLTPARIGRAAALSVTGLGLLAVTGAVVVALAQPAVAPPGADRWAPLPGMQTAVDWTYALCLGATAAVLASAAVNGHRRGAFRYAGPFALTVLAAVVLNAVGIGTMIRVADLLGTVSNPGTGDGRPDRLYVYDMVYALTPYLTLLPIAIVVGFALVQAVVLWRAAGPDRRRRIHDEYAALSTPDPPSAWDASALNEPARHNRAWPGGWTARIARGRQLAVLARDVDLLFSLLTVAALAVFGYVLVTAVVHHSLPWAPRGALTVSTWLAAGAPVAVLTLMLRGWRGLADRRHLGVLWDIGTFWPRAYHPLAPPSYTERAVPDLQRRLWRVHDHGGAVVLAAHSQGTVMAVAALLQEKSRPQRDGRPAGHVALVTFGSPLTKLYAWGFPAYFADGALGADRPTVWRWRNFYYETDFIGGPIFPDDPANEVDQMLTDPPTAWYVHGQQPPVLGRHSGYWTDPRVWDLVDRYAEELPLPGNPPPAR
ncbi:hypothetical protein [Micromonospora sp. NPDC002717]|uniref:hypothetical protein n=1 Tax=Micromonospora sp. NPDC002717 TaxID=3154424 RepID=UPI0033290672